jgi:hypothetical protein
MPTDVSTQNEPSVTQLVSGIITDAERLMGQQLDMLKAELKKDIRDTRETGELLLLGGALLSVAGLLLLISLALLLNWLTDGRLPLWASFGLVGLIVAAGGGIVFYRGRQKLEKLNPLPEKSAEALKENLQWKTNPN